MSARDHAAPCPVCGVECGGLNDAPCDCDAECEGESDNPLAGLDDAGVAQWVLDRAAEFREGQPHATAIADWLDSRADARLARALISQHADLERLRTALREACDIADKGTTYRWHARIQVLRALAEPPTQDGKGDG